MLIEPFSAIEAANSLIRLVNWVSQFIKDSKEIAEDGLPIDLQRLKGYAEELSELNTSVRIQRILGDAKLEDHIAKAEQVGLFIYIESAFVSHPHSLPRLDISCST
jgi:hypothetical protein